MPSFDRRALVPILALLMELAGVGAQLFLFSLLNDYARTAGCGEPCAYNGMAVIAMVYAARWVVIGGTVAALYLAARAWRGDGDGERKKGALAFHGMAAMLPLVLVLRFLTIDASARDSRTAQESSGARAAREGERPPTAGDERTAGYAWATDNGITAASQCTEGSARFVEGCTRYVQEHGGGGPAR